MEKVISTDNANSTPSSKKSKITKVVAVYDPKNKAFLTGYDFERTWGWEPQEAVPFPDQYRLIRFYRHNENFLKDNALVFVNGTEKFEEIVTHGEYMQIQHVKYDLTNHMDFHQALEQLPE